MDTQTVESLMAAASRIPLGQPEKLELLERAVALADLQNDLMAGFEARDELIEAAGMGGHPEKTLVAFAWMLAQWDKHGEDELGADEHSLLWKYKWVINTLWEFPSIAATQIEAAFDDFQARLERGGYSLRTLHYFRWKYAHHQGNWAEAESERTVWQRSSDDSMGDCSACEAHFLTDYLAAQKRDTEALEAARLILSGRQRCAEVPHVTYGVLLEPMLRLGQLEDACEAHLRGYRMVRDNPEFLATVGEHLAFLAYTHNTGPALALLERHLSWALETANLQARFEFYRSTLPLWNRLRDTGELEVKFRAPSGFTLEAEGGVYALDALEGWFGAQLEHLAARFDARNENGYFSSRLKADLELLERVGPLSLKAAPGKAQKQGNQKQGNQGLGNWGQK